MSTNFPKSERGDPTWEIAALFPDQGYWSEHDYLHLDTGRLIEFDNGKLEVHAMPTELHQAIVFFLCLQLRNFAEPSDLGIALLAPFKVRLWAGKFREPDVLFMLKKNRARRSQRVWDGADLVIEVVSEDDTRRDLVEKREEYAKAGIPEYWIVDPRDRSITVLTLYAPQRTYHQAVRTTDGQTAQSVLLEGFEVEVQTVFDRPEISME